MIIMDINGGLGDQLAAVIPNGPLVLSVGMIGVSLVFWGLVARVMWSLTRHEIRTHRIENVMVGSGLVLAAPLWLPAVGYLGDWMTSLLLPSSSASSDEPAPPPEPAAPPVDFDTIGLIVLGCLGAAALLLAIVWGAHGLWRDRADRRTRDALVDERLRVMRLTVDTIRTRLGEIQSSAVESLELYGLLDTRHEESAQFWEKWIGVTDDLAEAETTRIIPDGLRAKVDGIRRAWRVAYAHAEHLGVSAVGEDRQPNASKAIRTLRLAEGSNNEAEAALAWQRAASLLATLNLAHLPDETVRKIENRARAAITDGGNAWAAYDPNATSTEQDTTVPGARRQGAFL